MWALASVVRWHGTVLLTVAAHADSGLSAPAVICQTEWMQGSEFLELREQERKGMRRARQREMAKKKRGENWQPYKRLNIHITHTHTHRAVDAPLSVWHWCCQTNQDTFSLALTCSLVLERKPDTCDVAVTSSLDVWHERLESWVWRWILVFRVLEAGQRPTSNGTPHDTYSDIVVQQGFERLTWKWVTV